MGVVNASAGRPRYFSVSNPVQIGMLIFRPAVCYPIADAGMEQAVRDLADRGLAKLYPNEMRIVSGVAYPVNKQSKKGA
jgi:hypothetical protein